MTIEWNNRESFQEHHERMRGFRRSHADVALANAPRLDEPTLLESMEPLQIRCTMMETGGSRFLNSTADWSALVPIPKVARYKLSQN